MRKNYFLFILAILFTMNTMAQNIPSYVPKDGLVGYWPFNGNANDESGNGNHGTVNGATLTADRNGVANSAYSFGGNQNIDLGSFNSLSAIKSFSIAVWFNTSKETAGHDCFFSRGDYAQMNQFRGNIWVDGGLDFCMRVNGQEKHLTSKTSVNDSKWHLGIWSHDGNGNLSIYVDGKFEGSDNFNNLSDLPYNLVLGNLGNTPYFYKGILDEYTIYNRALSEQEISQLYAGCTKETVTSSNFNTLMYTTNAPLNLTATPTGGSFSGNGVANNAFNPSKAKLGKNQVKYNFKNTTGCIDSTDFTMLVVDTVGASCIKYDTVKVNKYDTLKITKFDTVTVKNNIYDTVTIKNNVFDTVIVKTNVFDTVKVNKYDTITIINNVTKYDTITVENNIYDTVTVTNNVTKYDTVIVKTNVFDTVKVTKYDTLTITNNVTKYDTVIVNKTNYDTVSILKIKFKLTTGIHANQLSSLSIYPNPTSDVLHIEVPDAKALEGYRYRIVDALGKEVYNQLVTQSTTEIPLKTLGAAGIYQFEILDAKNASIQSNKIVLQ